jgi:hypothetical protein
MYMNEPLNFDHMTFFEILHRKLADKYKLEIEDVRVIRIYSFTRNMSRRDIVFYCIKKLKRIVNPTRIARNNRIVNFLASCTDEAWMEVTEKTSYDKRAS